MRVLGRLLGRGGGQLLLVICSFAIAIALLVAMLLDSVGGPPAVAIAALLTLNALARLWLMRRGWRDSLHV